jgi:hypothetical protein
MIEQCSIRSQNFLPFSKDSSEQGFNLAVDQTEAFDPRESADANLRGNQPMD